MTKHSICGMKRKKCGLQNWNSQPQLLEKFIGVASYKSTKNSEHGDTIAAKTLFRDKVTGFAKS